MLAVSPKSCFSIKVCPEYFEAKQNYMELAMFGLFLIYTHSSFLWFDLTKPHIIEINVSKATRGLVVKSGPAGPRLPLPRPRTSHCGSARRLLAAPGLRAPCAFPCADADVACWFFVTPTCIQPLRFSTSTFGYYVRNVVMHNTIICIRVYL